MNDLTENAPKVANTSSPIKVTKVEERERMREVFLKVKILSDERDFLREFLRAIGFSMAVSFTILAIGIWRHNEIIMNVGPFVFLLVALIVIARWSSVTAPKYRSVESLAAQIEAMYRHSCEKHALPVENLKADDVKSLLDELKEGDQGLALAILTAINSLLPWSAGVLLTIAFVGEPALTLLRLDIKTTTSTSEADTEWLQFACLMVGALLFAPIMVQVIEKQIHQRRMRGLREYERQLREVEEAPKSQAGSS